MTFLETYIELNELAGSAREISDKLNVEISNCLKNLNKFLTPDDSEVPAYVEQYKYEDTKL